MNEKRREESERERESERFSLCGHTHHQLREGVKSIAVCSAVEMAAAA
jgi:hypothetical protein